MSADDGARGKTMSRRLGTQSATVRVAAVAAILGALAACSDRSMSITSAMPPAPSGAMPSGLGIVEASVDSAGNVTLTPLQSTGNEGTLAPGIEGNIYGTQNVNVRVYAAPATHTTLGSTTTWIMKFGVRNYLPYPIGSNQAGAIPSDTTGIFLALVGGPTVSQTSGTCPGSCAMNVTAYDGQGNFLGPKQPYLYWRERLAAKQIVAGLDTVSQRRTFKFTSPSQVTNFKFFLIVGADWPAPAQTSWSVFYNATTDSAPDSVSGRTAHAKPIWRRATQTTGFGNYSFGTDSWSPAGYVLNLSGSEDYYVYRRDSLADTTNAYMQVKAKVNGSTTSPEAVFGFLDGVRMVTVGMRSGQVGFVSVPRRFFGIFPVATFIGTPLTVDSTKSHTYTLHKFKADSVVLDVDAVRSSKLLYTALPLLANQIFTFTIGPAEFFGGGSFSGSSNATWTSVTYGIGDHL